MSKIKIIYNEEYDIQRVNKTIKDIDWFIANNYNYKNFSFPKTLDKERLRSYSEEEIKNAVMAEYNEDSYKENEKIINDNWEKIFKEIELAFLKSGLLCQDEYIIYLTKYGTGGSYNLPNTIIINISFKINMLQNVIHEIIHLAIQKYIDEYKIGQWQKERIVDLFYIRNFPRRISIQNVYKSMDTEKIDQTFDDNFSDMESVIQQISK